jgi:hypothetical protein
MKEIYYDILDEKRKEMLPSLVFLKNDFYLAGGTGLALQIGHRDSIDFDFFTGKDISIDFLYNGLKDVFAGKSIIKTQQDVDTLSVLIDGDIRMSFFKYDYELIGSLVRTEYFDIASLEDIGCMKCAAIISRSLSKDYVDLYFIIRIMGLDKLLNHCSEKFKDIDISLIMRSLVYFEDVVNEKINFKGGSDIEMKDVRAFLEEEVRKIEM